MSIFENTNVCRTCLSENVNLKSLFDSGELIEEDTLLCTILSSCVSLEVYKDDSLPQCICEICVEELKHVARFKQLCRKSDATLRKAILEASLDRIKFENDEGSSNIADNSNDKVTCDSFEETLLNGTCEDSLAPILYKENFPEEETLLNGTCSGKEIDCNSTKLKKIRKESSKKFIKKHISEDIKNELNFICENCGKNFNSEGKLLSHLVRHQKSHKSSLSSKAKNISQSCEICKKTFRFQSGLERHKLTHSGEKPFLCTVCGRSFAQNTYLKIHCYSHTGEKPYKCQMCDKSFSAPGTLMTHVRTHTGERPHVCKICGKQFPQSGYLKTHIRTHTGEKPSQCSVCHKRFNQSSRLIVHMRIHSGEKPYSCEYCGRGFAVRGTLKKHIRTHTGEKPYVCNVCGQTFAQQGTLANHLKVHRKNKC